MNSLLKWGLIGGAGWFLFRSQIEAALGLTTSTAAATTTTTTTTAAPSSGVTSASVATTRTLLYQWAVPNAFYQQQNSLMNGYQWNYGYNVVRGSNPPGPDVMFPGQDPNRLMTLDEYMTGLAKVNLSGLARIHAPRRKTAAAMAWRY